MANDVTGTSEPYPFGARSHVKNITLDLPIYWARQVMLELEHNGHDGGLKDGCWMCSLVVEIRDKLAAAEPHPY